MFGCIVTCDDTTWLFHLTSPSELMCRSFSDLLKQNDITSSDAVARDVWKYENLIICNTVLHLLKSALSWDRDEQWEIFLSESVCWPKWTETHTGRQLGAQLLNWEEDPVRPQGTTCLFLFWPIHVRHIPVICRQGGSFWSPIWEVTGGDKLLNSF